MAKIVGGGAFNVIPDSVAIGGTFRAFSKESLIQLKQRIEEARFITYGASVLYTLIFLFFFIGYTYCVI